MGLICRLLLAVWDSLYFLYVFEVIIMALTEAKQEAAAKAAPLFKQILRESIVRMGAL